MRANNIFFGPGGFVADATSYSNISTMILDADTEKLAIKFCADRISPITHIDMRFNVAWTGSPANFRMGIFSDSNDAPNAVLGDYTASFTAPAAAGWTGLQALNTNTGNLTIGSYYWMVIEYVSGTIDATNYIQMHTLTQVNNVVTRNKLRHHNGTNWTTTSPVNALGFHVFKHVDNSYSGGNPITAALARTGANDIFVNTGSNQVQGLKLRTGSKIKISGCLFYILKSGTPNDLTITVYEGDVSKYSVTIPVGTVLSNAWSHVYFPSSMLLAADTDIYIILSQTGTSDANDYDLNSCGINSTYIDLILSPDMRMVSGVLGVPSGLTVSTTEVISLFPIITDPVSDLDCASGSGASGPWGTIR